MKQSTVVWSVIGIVVLLIVAFSIGKAVESSQVHSKVQSAVQAERDSNEADRAERENEINATVDEAHDVCEEALTLQTGWSVVLEAGLQQGAKVTLDYSMPEITKMADLAGTYGDTKDEAEEAIAEQNEKCLSYLK